jgi:hypothetical protein
VGPEKSGGNGDDAPEGAAGSGPPTHGVSLAAHARIAAEIAEGNRSTAEVLDAHHLAEAAWNEATIHWMTRLGADVREHGQDARLPHLYSDAFAEAQTAQKPLPPTDAGSYATLVVDIQLAGGPTQPLAARGLSLADFLRLSRHWAKVLSSDPAEAALYFETFQALQPKAPEGRG